MASDATSDVNIARLTRLRDRAVIKREGYIAKFRSINELANRCAEDDDAASRLVVAMDSVEELWKAFTVEDDAILDCSLDLGQSDDYSNALGLEMSDIIIHAKSIVNRFCSRQPVLRGVNKTEHGDFPYVMDVHGSRPRGAANTITVTSEYFPAIHLPEIPLPSFSGDIFKWSSFRDRFVALVDQRSHLSNIDKAYYLLGCLKDSAMDSVRGIPVSGDSYPLLWSTLESRYDKPRLVAGSVAETLLKTPVSTDESLSELYKFATAFDESVSILESLQIPDLGDFILFSLASRCLPLSLRTLFESQVMGDYPKVRDLLLFVKFRITVLERAQDTRLSIRVNQYSRSSGNPHTEQRGSRTMGKISPSALLATETVAITMSCKCCHGGHNLTSCPRFTGWSLNDRSKWAREKKLLFRCLEEGHWAPRCRSSAVCSVCSRKHHTLVHKDGIGATIHGEKSPEPAQMTAASLSSVVNPAVSHSIILGTALVHIRDVSGVLHTARALVNSASQISAITTDCSTRLGLRMTRWTAPVFGLSGTSVLTVQGVVDCQVQLRFSDKPVLPFKAWVFPSITTLMPRQSLSTCLIEKYKHLALADSAFTSPAPIDLLLGVEIFGQILDGKRVAVDSTYPVAFGSIFGWIVIGPVPHDESQSLQVYPISLTTSVESMMDKFWSVEEPESAPAEFTEDGQCENMFLEGYSRSESGRFSVPLPFRHSVGDDEFQGSRLVALKWFEHLERQLVADPRLQELYGKFMSEYLALGHMSRATSQGDYFIPHHAIYRPAEEDPKIRVVFDASAQSSSGRSLNGSLLPGPKLQRDIVDVLVLFRLRRYAFTTDICKMYQQILINPEFRCFLHILWRESPHERLEEYEPLLPTVLTVRRTLPSKFFS